MLNLGQIITFDIKKTWYREKLGQIIDGQRQNKVLFSCMGRVDTEDLQLNLTFLESQSLFF